MDYQLAMLFYVVLLVPHYPSYPGWTRFRKPAGAWWCSQLAGVCVACKRPWVQCLTAVNGAWWSIIVEEEDRMRIQGHCQWHEPFESIMGDTRPYLKKQNLNQNQIKTFHFKLKPNKTPWNCISKHPLMQKMPFLKDSVLVWVSISVNRHHEHNNSYENI